MRRQGNLINKIADLDNLMLAFYKARCGKRAKGQVHAYERRLQGNLLLLREQILSGTVETGGYHYFTIYDPKERVICAAPFPQRVMHHALMNVAHPCFERVQVYDSYATRPDKGTYAALDRAKRFVSRFPWYLKLDFRKYFDSLDHDVLKKQLRRLFKDPMLLGILEMIIDTYDVNHNQGVPIGNLTSQYFANHYLTGLDHHIKEGLRIKAYVRYMDDLVLWHQDKSVLLQAGKQIKSYSSNVLGLTLKPFELNRTEHGLPFLGYVLFPGRVKLSRRSRLRFIRKLSDYETHLHSGEWTPAVFQNHVTPLVAFTEYASARGFRKKVMANA